MPELPDIVVYLDCLEPRVKGQALEKVRLASPFLLRTVEPVIESHYPKTGLFRIKRTDPRPAQIFVGI